MESMESFASNYFEYVGRLLNQLDKSKICSFIKEMEFARSSGNTVFIVGNGGSAATASHLANDFGEISIKKGAKVKPLRAFALSDNNAFFSAIANDHGYDRVFVNQLMVHYRKGDYLVVISASGNSLNVVNAAKWVQAEGGKVIGLIGFDGGELKRNCDISIIVETPAGKYGPVEDVHVIINHMVAAWFLSI